MRKSSPIWPGEPKPAPTSGPRLSIADSDEPITAIASSTSSTTANSGPNEPTKPRASGRNSSSLPPT